MPLVRARTPPAHARSPARPPAGPTAGRRAGRRSACARTPEPPQAKRSPASRRGPPGAALLVPTSPAPAPSGRCRRAGASPHELPLLPPHRCRRPPRTARTTRSHASMVTSRCPAAYATSPRTDRSAGPARPSASAFMNSSKAAPRSPRAAASRARWRTASPTASVIARQRSQSHRTRSSRHRPVTVEVTAVMVSLTPIGCRPQTPRRTRRTHAERNSQRRRVGIRGERSGRTRAAHQPRHCRRLPTASGGTGARRPLPADPLPQARLGRKHPHPAARQPSPTTPPTPRPCSTTSVCDPSTSQATQAARRSPRSWRSTTPSTCTRSRCWSRR